MTRRRGDALESAILEAGWDQLVQGGYDNFTFETVAERAQTSRTVLYRRWSAREELLIAVVHRRGINEAIVVPDTGSLRTDVLEVLTNMMSEGRGLTALFGALVSAQYQQSGLTPADVRRAFIGDRASTMSAVIQRAIERGEVDESRITPRVITVASDLVRGQALLNLGTVSRAEMVAIVDEVFLPLVVKR